MKTNIERKLTYHLELNENEARWLKSLVQNPIGCNYEDEPEDHRDIRTAFWEALADVEI